MRETAQLPQSIRPVLGRRSGRPAASTCRSARGSTRPCARRRRRSSRGAGCRCGSSAVDVDLILKLTVSPLLTLICVAKPWSESSPAPSISQSSCGVPAFVFSHATGLATGASHGRGLRRRRARRAQASRGPRRRTRDLDSTGRLQLWRVTTPINARNPLWLTDEIWGTPRRRGRGRRGTGCRTVGLP